ncbi:MAG: biotin--[acetyl-CoA-carboxylase] ligase, partial [Bacillota bacterium]
MTRAYLGLGSNLGDRASYLRRALGSLARDLRLLRISPVYETAPWGNTQQGPFLNLVAEVETPLAPEELLAVCQRVEQELGRRRLVHWGPRTMDVDVLLFGDQILDRPDLTVPHPRMADRAFVLVPLADLVPGLVLPGDGRCVRDALWALPESERRGVRPWAGDLGWSQAPRAAILEALRQAQPAGGYVSGQELSRRLGLSRTAVWKHIQELRAAGYEVEAHTRLGYRLTAVTEMLVPEAIAAHRGEAVAGPPGEGGPAVPGQAAPPRLGEPLECHRSLASTNERARALAARGLPEGLTVIAWEQTAGRGRLGRAWTSPPGGLWMSVLLRPPVAPAEIAGVTLTAAVAVAEAIELTAGVRVGIKWPNDLLVDGRKVCGILTELAAEADRVNHVVVGIGINANLDREALPEAAPTPPTSLRLAAGRDVSLPRLAAAVLDRLEAWYGRLAAE